MRVVKDYDERRNEILDAAEKLFHTKGYEKCTINDILKEVGIAKGTFYYYFKSKKEVLNAIVSRYTTVAISRAEAILQTENASPEEKLLNIFLAMNIQNEVGEDVLDEMHKAENALLHQTTLKEIVTRLTPILVKVIEEGIEQKRWQCQYPKEYMQIFLASAITLTDEGIFEVDGNAQMRILTALVSLLEKMLEVPEHTFMKLFRQNWG